MKYHINPETGNASPCRAQHRCRFDSMHYDTIDEARAMYELIASSPFTPDEERHIWASIKYECDRQHVGEDRQRFLYRAYREAFSAGTMTPTGEEVLALAGMLEPDNGGKIRVTPVTFADGGSSASPDVLPHVYQQLFDNVDGFTANEDDVRYWVKEFLWIHPFSDGNGRAGFLLYNWLKQTWRRPEPLPYMFGEKPHND